MRTNGLSHHVHISILLQQIFMLWHHLLETLRPKPRHSCNLISILPQEFFFGSNLFALSQWQVLGVTCLDQSLKTQLELGMQGWLQRVPLKLCK